MTEAALTHDAFLCGRLHLWQPAKGYRAATDPVLLAAACPALPGQSVLDLGCGVGAAALCLGSRVADLQLSGLELLPEYAALARRNGLESGQDFTVHQGDLREMPRDLRRDFDHVITNPPYYPAGGTPSPRALRATAMQVDQISLTEWVQAASRRLRPGGWLTMIHGADSLPQVLAALSPGLGTTSALPLTPREGRPALRILIRARKGGKGAFRLLAPLILHRGAAHDGDRESYTPRANEVLRGGAALDSEFAAKA